LWEADRVFYEGEVGWGVRGMITFTAEKIYVCMRSDDHTMIQQRINRLLLEYALEGKKVVRLKGGDPFLFGRGGEELELLAAHQIPFEVVPGVPSAFSVPAYQGIPVTHRDICSSVHIITGHHQEGAVNHVDYEALVRTEGTLIFLMGVASLDEICRGLLDAGMDPDVPAALLMRGTTAHQERILSPLGTLCREAKRQDVKTPGVIVVGEVCALAERFSWYEKMPLGGMKLLLTRPQERIGETSRKLRDLGAEVLEIPTIRTVRRKNNPALRQALRRLEQYEWIVFTSPTGVRIFFEELRDQRQDLRRLGQIRIAAMGNGTGKELERHGLYPDLVPEVYDGEHLGQALAGAAQPGARVLIPRAAAGNRALIDALSRQEVDDIPIYDTVIAGAEAPDGCRGDLENGEIDAVIFTSASCVRGFASVTEGMYFSSTGTEAYSNGEAHRDLLSGLKAVCIGKQTAREAESFGMKTVVSEKADMDSLTECLIRMRNKMKN
ncbi:MAG: uroporphyrinogen-III C-methyltransferase, partial [Clostridiales bacterium]|nr:uroporphyrinogen-III C-methyltransferase [Clostridiales bacterium]